MTNIDLLKKEDEIIVYSHGKFLLKTKIKEEMAILDNIIELVKINKCEDAK